MSTIRDVPPSTTLSEPSSHKNPTELSALGDISAGLKQWRVWGAMAWQDIRLRYKRSILGPFWISASIGTMIVALAILYSQILQVPFREYTIFLSVSFLFWFFISALILEGGSSMTEHEGFLQNVGLPLTTFALKTVYRALIVFLHNLLAVMLILLFLGGPMRLEALWIIPATLAYCVTGFFVALVLGPLCARFRDIQQILISVMQAAMFLTPVFWMPNAIKKKSFAIEGNPFHHYLEIARRPMLDGTVPTDSWIVVGLSILVLAAIAVAMLPYNRRKIFYWI